MDIISSFPDPILCHILSFLPIKSSGATSVLARRWRFLWTHVRKLHFERDYFGPEPEDRMGFADMVYRVLLLHNGPIDSLIIWPNEKNIVSKYQIDAWISTAVARNVQVLFVYNLFDVELPQSCCKCRTLVELTIEQCTISAKPGTVCLPKLKKLNLISNYYEDDESLTNLVSGCLTIENLVIQRDFDGCEMLCCNICSPTLKSLVLRCSVICYAVDDEHKLVLDIPAVQYLLIYDTISYIIWAENLPSLVVADIWLSNHFFYEDEESIGRWRDTFHFVEKLSNAKSLTFKSSALMKVLNPTFSIATTRFHNLTKLTFEADWHILTELLESAYKLELLTIKKVKGELEDKLKCWREPKHLPECLLSSLKYVYISGFAGGEHELNMVRYILRHAKVLKTINIYSASHDKDSKLNMLQRISYFPRGSKNCRLTFV